MTKLNDGIVSANNSLGERSQARTYTKNRQLNDRTLKVLYEDNWIVQKFIDQKTTDMLRLDREIKNSTPELDKAIEQFCKKYDVFNVLDEHNRFGRLYGDALIMAVTEIDGAEDVNMEGMLDLSRERLVKFIVFDKQSYTPSTKVSDDITSPLFGMPVSYKINVGQGFTVNASRVHRLSCGSKSMTDKLKGGKQSLGVTEVAPLWQSLIAYDTAKTGISDMIEECKVDVIKIKDYNIAMAEGREADFIQLGLSMKTVKSLANVLMIDQDAEFETKEFASNWINEALKESRIDVAAAMGMPLTRAFGQSAAGFASGEEDNKIYYEHINSKQESQLRPAWNFIDKFLLDEIETDVRMLDFDFPSIADRSEKEQAEILKIIIDSLKVLYDIDAVDAVQIAREIQLRGIITTISDEDIEKLKAVINDPSYTKPEENSGGGFF